MSEWWTYALEDFLLFSPRTYYRLFELYNEAVWPLHLLTLALGAVIFILLHRREAWSGSAVAALLAALWLFVAWMYLLERYTTINWAALYFAAAFAVQALLLIWGGLVRKHLVFEPHVSIIHRLGLGLFVFALIIQPLLAPVMGRPWSQAEVFGIAPDPTAVATLGIVLTATQTRWDILIIPVLWCVLSGLKLVAMKAPDSFVIFGAACIAVGLAAWKSLSPRQSQSSIP